MKRIYIAEDDYDNAEIFQEAVSDVSTHSEVIHAKDGLELLGLLQQKDSDAPDAIFLDLNMPRLNGLDCLHQIKSDPTLNKIPIFILSTSDAPENINQTFKYGATRYIVKPDSYKRLTEIVDLVIAKEWGREDEALNINDYLIK